MDNATTLYLDLLIPIILVMSKDMDVVTKNIIIGLYIISVALMNSIVFNTISMDVIIIMLLLNDKDKTPDAY